jgi:alpha-galactosidase
MTIAFSLQDGVFKIAGEEGLRIAFVNAYAVYSLPGSKQRCAMVEPGSFSVTQVSMEDAHGSGTQTILTGESPGGLELAFRVNQYHDRPFILLRLSVCNLGREAVHLRELVLLDVPEGQLQVDPPGSRLDFFKVGWHGWAYSGLRRASDQEPRTLLSWLARTQYSNPTTRHSHQQGEFSSEGWAILAGERMALVVGLVSMADQFGQVTAACQPGRLGLRLAAQADGILLEPDETFDSEWGYIQTLTLPDPDPAREYACAVARQMGARVCLKPPPLQWTHWYHFFQQISAQKFISNLDAIKESSQQVPFQIVQLDDGYQPAWGDWTTTNAKFPAGLADLAERVREAGYTPGLWLSPFVVQPGSQIHKDHPDWLLCDRRGRWVNAGFFYSFLGRALDPTHPAVQKHLVELTETLTREWGFGLLKLDYCYAGALPGRHYDPRATRAQALRRGLETIRRAAGDETFLLGCGCPFGPAIGVVDAMRIGPDTAPQWEPWFNWLPWARSLLRRESSPPSLRNSLRHLLNLSCLHRRWWWNDPDCLLMRSQDTGLTEAEVRSSVTLTGLSGGMVVDSDDLTRLPPERMELLSLLTPLLSPGGQPLDLLECDMPELYHVPVQAAAGSWHLIGLFNWQDCPVQKHLSLSQLGFSPGQLVYVFNFWAQRGWLTGDSELIFPEIPAHGCLLLRICNLEPGVQAIPVLLGDTLHITQGLEIAEWNIGTDRLEIRTIDLDRQANGILWLALPAPPVSAVCNGTALDIAVAGDGVYRLPLQFTGEAKIEIMYHPQS